MDEVTLRELRKHGGDVLVRVEHGETLIVTRFGVPVAELRPLPKSGVTAETLLARWQSVPHISAATLRTDVDAVLDQELHER